MLLVSSILLLLSTASASESLGPPLAARRDAPSIEVTLAYKDKFYGHGTWYMPGLGACGTHATSHDYIVAINQPQYHGKVCYKHVHIMNTMNGKSVRAQIQDDCPSCAYGSLDMSPVVFAALAETGLGEGKIAISWSFSGSFAHSHSHSHVHIHKHKHKQHKHRQHPRVPMIRNITSTASGPPC